jgi:hypothetical protein
MGVWAFLGAAEPGREEEEAVRTEMGRNPDAEWQQQQLGEAAWRIPKGGSGSWRAMMTARDLAVVDQAAGTTLRAWGYPESRGQGTGNREQGTGNGEQGTGNGEQGTGNSEQ